MRVKSLLDKLVRGVFVLTFLLSVQSNANTLVVSTNPLLAPNFTSLAAAVNAASDGDIIKLDLGNWQEEVVITKNLTIEKPLGK